MLSGEATNTDLIVFGLTSGLEPMIYCTKESMLTITPPMQLTTF